MASRLVTTSFALVSTAALLAGCDTVSGWFGGKESSGSSGTSYSSNTGSGAPAHGAYTQTSPAANSYASGGYDSAATAASTAYQPGEMVSGDKVKHAQQALKDQGLYKGPVDGVVGPQTRDAVAQYQRGHNLKPTAMLDDQTMRSLDRRMSANTRQ